MYLPTYVHIYYQNSIIAGKISCIVYMKILMLLQNRFYLIMGNFWHSVLFIIFLLWIDYKKIIFFHFFLLNNDNENVRFLFRFTESSEMGLYSLVWLSKILNSHHRMMTQTEKKKKCWLLVRIFVFPKVIQQLRGQNFAIFWPPPPLILST